MMQVADHSACFPSRHLGDVHHTPIGRQNTSRIPAPGDVRSIILEVSDSRVNAVLVTHNRANIGQVNEAPLHTIRSRKYLPYPVNAGAISYRPVHYHRFKGRILNSNFDLLVSADWNQKSNFQS